MQKVGFTKLSGPERIIDCPSNKGGSFVGFKFKEVKFFRPSLSSRSYETLAMSLAIMRAGSNGLHLSGIRILQESTGGVPTAFSRRPLTLSPDACPQSSLVSDRFLC
jgi:hypothetical protein